MDYSLETGKNKDFWYADFAFMNISFLKSWDLFSAFLLCRDERRRRNTWELQKLTSNKILKDYGEIQ